MEQEGTNRLNLEISLNNILVIQLSVSSCPLPRKSHSLHPMTSSSEVFLLYDGEKMLHFRMFSVFYAKRVWGISERAQQNKEKADDLHLVSGSSAWESKQTNRWDLITADVLFKQDFKG